MIQVFYHSADSDGWCSAAILHNFLRMSNKEHNLVPINYDECDTFEELRYPNCDNARHIYMVDFSLQPWSLMEKFIRRYGYKLTWIDHHIEVYKEYIKCDFGDMDFGFCGSTPYPAACELLWNHLNKSYNINSLFGVSGTPFAVELVSIWDAWQHKINLNCQPFHWGLESMKAASDPDSSLWNDLLSGDQILIDKLMIRGEAIMSYRQAQIDRNMPNRVFSSSFITPDRTYDAVCVNWGKGSWQFKGYGEGTDFRVVFERMSKGWKIHLNPTWPKDHNAGEVAKLFGGGGHKGAAGFTVETFEELREIFPEV